MKSSIIVAAVIGILNGSTEAWTSVSWGRIHSQSALWSSPSNNDIPAQREAQDAGLVSSVMGMDPEDPCWQDIYDNDCAMSTIYSASFIAKDWIKSMPCAEGIDDCDMPAEVSYPGPEGIDKVDVMNFLGIKRAGESLNMKP